MEKNYTFLKNNVVENTLVFAGADNDLAKRICTENNYDGFIWLNEELPPARWSTYDAKTNKFTPSSADYLISIGILTEQLKEVK